MVCAHINIIRVPKHRHMCVGAYEYTNACVYAQACTYI